QRWVGDGIAGENALHALLLQAKADVVVFGQALYVKGDAVTVLDTVAKGFTLSYVVTAESADAYRDFTPIPCGSLSHAGVRTHTSAGYDLCPAHTNPNKAKGGWPYRANRLFFFKMSASLRI
ncbi:hypothetical protein, partial [Pseudomonas sp. ER28]|uniref:hypothetical protein n=1 Tax=Pseudomonas sp. ER28 TaxID=3033801 RepID=UPI003F5B2F7F